MKISVGKILSTVSTIQTGINVKNLVGNIDVKSISPNGIQGLSSGMEQKIQAMSTDMESKMSEGMTEDDIASMVDNMQSGFDPENMSMGDMDQFANKIQGLSFK